MATAGGGGSGRRQAPLPGPAELRELAGRRTQQQDAAAGRSSRAELPALSRASAPPLSLPLSSCRRGRPAAGASGGDPESRGSSPEHKQVFLRGAWAWPHPEDPEARPSRNCGDRPHRPHRTTRPGGLHLGPDAAGSFPAGPWTPPLAGHRGQPAWPHPPWPAHCSGRPTCPSQPERGQGPASP